MRIVQIAPEIGAGSGVAGVAANLEREWQDLGVVADRFTLREARGGWLPQPGPGVAGRLVHIVRVVWFSTVGTAMARRYLAAHPDAVSLCHNDAVVGDVYVNHGILEAAMRARGRYWWRMVRNPLHLFTSRRDRLRYGTRSPHDLVVNLTSAEDELLRSTYPRLATNTTVIGNGVDVDHFRPGSPDERREARERFGLPPDAHVLLFVGHEYDRKGLPLVLRVLARVADDVQLLVVGGTSSMVEATRAGLASALGGRVHFTGSMSDPRPAFHAADAFVLPSAYESYGLVVLEALACAVPVLATPTGCVPDVVVDGCNGYTLPAADEAAWVAAVDRLRELDVASVRAAARATAEQHTWAEIARLYLDALRQVGADREPSA